MDKHTISYMGIITFNANAYCICITTQQNRIKIQATNL